MNKQWVWVVGLAVCLLGMIGCGKKTGEGPSARKESTAIGPEISLSIREASAEASVVSLDQYEDKIVLVNIWATWSKPCREECAALNRLQEKFRDRGVVVLGVLLDKSEDEARAYVQSQPWSYANGWVEPAGLQPPFNVQRVIPTKYLLNRRHALSGAPVEGIVPEDELQRRIEELL